MNIRSTSVEAYKKVVDSGLLSIKLVQAFTIIYRFGPMTSREANQRFVETYRTENNLNQFRALLTHLQNMGVIATTEKVVCPISKMKVYNFDVTGRLPIKEKTPSMKDKKRDMLATVDRIEPWLSNFALSEVVLLKQQISNL